MIELRYLRTLLAIEETGSVSLAAKRVFLTQSALSHQIRALESHYGTPLFERKSSPVRFTHAGERLLQLAHELLPRVAAAERDLAQIIEEVKVANSEAKVIVKIPVVPNIGTIAVGIAKAGADIIMAAYNTVDGVPCHINSYLLREVLRKQMGYSQKSFQILGLAFLAQLLEPIARC